MAVDKAKLLEQASFLHFCKTILVWDYFRLLADADKRVCDDEAATSHMREVKNTYTDVDDYISTFEPLLFEEVKAHIIQRKDEGQDGIMRLVMECNERDGFLLPEVTYNDSEVEKISQNDLMLLSKEQIKEGSQLPRTYAFALVEQRQMKLLRLRMYLVGKVINLNEELAESSPRLLNMRAFIISPLMPQEKPLFCIKICSLSTISREYFALRSIGSLPFKDVILRAEQQKSEFEDQTWRISHPLHKYFVENLNTSQLEAINAGLSRKAFVLIQGPPGTGKTQTILALLSAILHATPARICSKNGFEEVKYGHELSIQEKYHHWALASPWLTNSNPRDLMMPMDGDDGYFPTGNELKPEVIVSNRQYNARILVCAPSNSALDEIVLRLLRAGIHDDKASTYNPKIVRIGLNAHHSVQGVCVNHLVKQKKGQVHGDVHTHGAANGDTNSMRASILEEAVIVFSTLSFSGSALLTSKKHVFDIVIIDEAAQAVEPATLVPLASGCKQVFLIGDPFQLPATVISPTAVKFGYGTSLFERFQRAGYPVTMLRVQYRMHPQIRSFPSGEFYNKALEDAEDMESKSARAWHEHGVFGPFCFFDLHEGKESKPSESGSWMNADEVEFALLLYHKLVSLHGELRSSSQVAIISPYRYQIKLFQDRFCEMFHQDPQNYVDIQTVDGFQGREKDVAIFSCVRASNKGGIGFVSDSRRMNVGITRAKSSILVVGSASTLRHDQHWNNLIKSAEERRVLFKVSKPYASFFSDSSLQSFRVKPGRPPAHAEPELMEVEKSEIGDNSHGGAHEEQTAADDDVADDDAMDEGDWQE